MINTVSPAAVTAKIAMPVREMQTGKPVIPRATGIHSGLFSESIVSQPPPRAL